MMRYDIWKPQISWDKKFILKPCNFFLFDLFRNKLDGYCLQKIFIEPIQVHFKSYFKYLKLLKVMSNLECVALCFENDKKCLQLFKLYCRNTRISG